VVDRGVDDFFGVWVGEVFVGCYFVDELVAAFFEYFGYVVEYLVVVVRGGI